MNIWINRAYIAEKLNLRPAYTFMFAVMWLTGINFVLELLESPKQVCKTTKYATKGEKE